MVPHAPVLALVLTTLLAAVTGPALASGDRDALSDETIGLMIDDSGPGQAEALLGVLYLRGMRIESDPIAASAWLDRAARAGHPAGVYGAARMHADGIGVPVDTARARQLLRDADPGRFGPLADAVRRLRHDLGLPEVAAGDATPKPAEDAVKPPPVEAAAEQAKDPPHVPAAAAETALPAVPAVAERPVASGEPVPESEPAATIAAAATAPQPPPARPTAAEPPPAADAPPAEVVAGPFAQLATLFSEASTSSEMTRIRGIVPAHLLQGRELSVRPVRLGDGRTAWRIVATGFTHRDDVRIFCGLVAASGLGCLPRQ